MIARWAGRCSICDEGVRAGEDIHYDAEAKSVQHWDCFENPQPTAAEIAAAERCGYAAAAAIDSDEWPAIYRDWHLLPLPPSSGSPAARRPETPARPRRQSTLFGA
ncbi:MAG TPA: hypothetical protein VIY07_16800 [Pseudolabrys sp.]